MSAIDRSLDAVAFVSDHFREFLWRRLSELGGLALLTLSLITAVALATWSVQDPSLSHATNLPVHNLLGASGAVIADLLMQLFGLAAAIIIVPIALAGWRLLAHRPFGAKLRQAAWLPAMLFGAAFASCWPTTKSWPLPTGLGGVLGDALLQIPAFFGAGTGGVMAFVMAIIVGFLMLASVVVAVNLHWPSQEPMKVARRRVQPEDEIDDDSEEEDDDRVGFFSKGMVIHALLSAKARLGRALGRMIRRAMRPAPEALPRVAAPRMEPTMGATGRAPVPRAAPADDMEYDEGDDVEVIQPQAVAPRKATTRQAVRRSSSGYQLPPISLLAAQKVSERTTLSNEIIQENAVQLESVLGDFGVRGEIINARPGPVVTLYELEPAPGIKSSRVIGLADDIARSMSAVSARVAVVSGRNAIGIELPNPNREKVYLRQLLDADDYNESTHKLPLCLGKTIGGDSVIVDLARMPHLLIAGTTGSGKSVAINTMILSLLYRLRPDQCRLIMVDPKMLELSVYDNIPHLLTPVVTDPKKAVVALKWAVREMEGRYKKMSKLGVRNIDGYNIRVAEAKAKGETLTRTVHTGYDKESGQAIYEKEELDLEPLPYIVVIVDEMADLMMVAGKDIEGAVQRLAQMARAAGIHVILATQRPSVDVITGTIKANFPTRISFQVTSKIDSRTILGEQGAEQLLGQGDMLYMAGGGRISRVHGPFVSDDEVEKVVRHLKSQGAPEYLEEVTASTEEEGEDGGSVFDATGMGTEGAGDLYEQAVAIVRRDRKASTSYIQRRLQIGYNRAASLMERLEQEGVVGQPNHAGKREILLPEVADEF
jgi:S-DNA-T family DNA segregation ATPase FtsK/SpoIIIE